MYYFVTSDIVMREISKCKYFRVNLGLSSTIERNDSRELRVDDRFAYAYNMQYKTTIYAKGNIGDLKFYVDLYIKDPIMAVYDENTDEVIIEVNFDDINTKGIDAWLGSILKRVDDEIEERRKISDNNTKLNASESNSIIGDPNKIGINPGNVRYEDLILYMQQNKNNRL